MIALSCRTVAAAFASLLLVSSAFGQATSPATPAPTTKAAPAKKAEKPRSAESRECSKQADAKGLHGKERKKFRSECIKNAKGDEKAK